MNHPADFRKPPRSYTHRIADNAQLVWIQMREMGAPVNGNPNLVDLNMRDAINAVFPENHVTGAGGKKRGTGKSRTTTAVHEKAITFHAEISIYLKYSGMVTLTRKPAPHADGGPRPSRWALATDWLDIPDEIVLARARASHDTLEADCENPVHATLAAAELVGHSSPAEPVRSEGETVSVSLKPADASPATDPISILQAILKENAELKVRVNALEGRNETLASQLDIAVENLNAANAQVRAANERWAALRALLEMDVER